MFVIISGVSGTGKTTLINEVLNNNNNFEYPRCVTTRPKRTTDRDDRYIFTSLTDFKNYILSDELLEYQLYKNNYYGTLKESYYQIQNNNKTAITDMGYEGIISLKSKIDNVINILIDTDLNLVADRMIQRGESIEIVKKRLENIKKEYDALLSISDYVINNNCSINNTLQEFTKVVKKGRVIK